MEMAMQVGEHMLNGDDATTAFQKIDWIAVSKEAALGGVTGLIGIGSAKYITKATNYLRSPAGRKVLNYIAEMGVDAAVSMAADMGYSASGLEDMLYGAMGYSRLSSKEIEQVGRDMVYKELVEKYGEDVIIGEEVYGAFKNGQGKYTGKGTYFDFVVYDPVTEKVLEVVESKASGRFDFQLSENQKMYYEQGLDIELRGKVASELGIKGTISTKTTESKLIKTAVNKFTGKGTRVGAQSFIKKVLQKAK